jgi:hypothetical protein
VHDTSITLSWSNLEAVCLDCHNKEHMTKGTATADGISFDAEGNVVYTSPAAQTQASAAPGRAAAQGRGPVGRAAPPGGRRRGPGGNRARLITKPLHYIKSHRNGS